MRNKKIFVFKIVWRKSIATPHRLTQAVQRANLRRTAGDPTWVCHFYKEIHDIIELHKLGTIICDMYYIFWSDPATY